MGEGSGMRISSKWPLGVLVECMSLMSGCVDGASEWCLVVVLNVALDGRGCIREEISRIGVLGGGHLLWRGDVRRRSWEEEVDAGWVGKRTRLMHVMGWRPGYGVDLLRVLIFLLTFSSIYYSYFTHFSYKIQGTLLVTIYKIQGTLYIFPTLLATAKYHYILLSCQI